MKLHILKDALELYELSIKDVGCGGELHIGDKCAEYDEKCPGCDQLTTDIANCWIELAEMEKAAPDSDYCEDVTVIPTELMLDFGNKMWYNTYGRMARRLPNGRDIPANFINAVRKEEYITEVSDLVLNDVYDFLRDLWADNERDGENDTDGTFKRPIVCDHIDMLQDLVNDKLDAIGYGVGYERYAQLGIALSHYRQDQAHGCHTACTIDEYLEALK